MNRISQTLLAVAVGSFFGMGHIHAAKSQTPWYEQLRPVEDPVVWEVIESVPEEDVHTDEVVLPYATYRMLAALVMAEAGNQDLTGKKLVVDTVLNRVADPDFPDTIEGVIYQKNQYSVVWNGQMRKYLEGREAITDDCFTAVNEELIDQVDYAAIYFNAGGWPGYGTRLYKYGGHYFESR